MSNSPKSRLPKEFRIVTGDVARRENRLRAAGIGVAPIETDDALKERHKRFVDAVHGAFGMWKGREDIPLDGLEYERIVRGKCL